MSINDVIPFHPVALLKDICAEVIINQLIRKWIKDHYGVPITKKIVLEQIANLDIDKISIQFLQRECPLIFFSDDYNQVKSLNWLSSCILWTKIYQEWPDHLSLDQYLNNLHYRLAEKEAMLKQYQLNSHFCFY